MYNLKFSEEQERVRQMVKEFSLNEVLPGAKERDLNEDFLGTRDLLKKMGNLGLMGLPYSKEYGGAGLGYVDYALAGFELNKVDASVGISYSVHISLGSGPIYNFGNEEQKKKYLPKLFSGEYIAAFGLTEPCAGSDAGASQCTAILKDNKYILNGIKCFTTNGEFADVIIIFAMTNPALGTKGISAFIVEPNKFPGLKFVKREKKMGIRASVQNVMEMDNLEVPAENLLGKEGEGFKIAMATLDSGRIGVAAHAVGIAKGAYEYSLNYSKERVQFGKPISKLQVIAFKLADMYAKIEGAEALTLKAAWIKDQHLSYSTAAAVAKLTATNVAMEVTTEAVQVLGGAGFTMDHPVERMMRDAKITQIYEGTNEVQKLVISGSILR